MRAVVDISENKVKANKKFSQFVKDMETTVKLCKPYLPETKGKVTDDSLIYYKGQRYSISPKYIRQFVKVKQIDNILYIYTIKK